MMHRAWYRRVLAPASGQGAREGGPALPGLRPLAPGMAEFAPFPSGITA
jgi:hypothetical protein